MHINKVGIKIRSSRFVICVCHMPVWYGTSLTNEWSTRTCRLPLYSRSTTVFKGEMIEIPSHNGIVEMRFKNENTINIWRDTCLCVYRHTLMCIEKYHIGKGHKEKVTRKRSCAREKGDKPQSVHRHTPICLDQNKKRVRELS